MDITERKITKIARETEKLVLLSLREEGVGTAEIDLIHALRHHPGCTQAALAELLHADKAAIARRTKKSGSERLLGTSGRPERPPQSAAVSHGKGGSHESLKAEIEASFYEYLTSVLTDDESKTFAVLLNKLYAASKTESRAGFPHFIQAQRK